MDIEGATSPLGLDPPALAKGVTNGSLPFCTTPLWDSNVTWYTDDPDFTLCFHATVMQYVPTAFLGLSLPYVRYSVMASRSRNVPMTLRTLARLILISALSATSAFSLGWFLVVDGSYLDLATVLAPVINLLGYMLAFGVQVVYLKHGRVTSGVLFSFWLVKAALEAATFRRSIREFRDSPLDPSSASELIDIVEYPMILIVFVMSFFADAKPKYMSLDGDKSEAQLSPETFASFPSKLVFSWFDPMAWKGWKSTLVKEDLWDLSYEDKYAGVVPEWDKIWDEARGAKNQDTSVRVAIFWPLMRAFGPGFAASALLQLAYSTSQFINPQIVNALISFVQSDEPVWKGYFYTVLIFAVSFVNTLLNAQCYHIEYKIGLRMKTALISSIYRKSLRLSNTGRKEMTVGETTNLMAIDTQKLMELLLYINMGWASPLQIILAMYFLWQILGPSSLAGLTVMVVMIPLNTVVTKKMRKYQVDQMKNKDKRTRLMDEIVNGIKIIKLYAWETPFRENVQRIRDAEMATLLKTAYLNSVTTFLWTSAPVMVALASFASFVLSSPDNNLDANTAFVSLTLFNLLRVPLNLLPMLIINVVQCQVSINRINNFMNADELQDDAVQPLVAPSAEGDGGPEEAAVVVRISGGSYNWDRSGSVEGDPILSQIDLEVAEGSLVAVVGQVGSGKSSLLSAILGEMNVLEGTMGRRGKVSYVPQQAWMQNATVADNVTFGRRLDERLYRKVLTACALDADLEVLPAGDATEIGEKGINLSGGQKQRIAMARAVYNNGDLFLLDDPLSAVDANVGKHIFENVIGPKGLLKRKTRVLVTNGVVFLKHMDRIVVLKDGRVSEQGSFEELLARKGDFADFLVNFLAEETVLGGGPYQDPTTGSELEDLKQNLEAALGKSTFDIKMRHASKSVKSSRRTKSSSGPPSVRSQVPSLTWRTSRQSQPTSRQVSRQVSHAMSQSSQQVVKQDQQGQKGPTTVKRGQRLIAEENVEVGGVKLQVYLDYFVSVGLWMSVLSVGSYVAFQGFSLGSNIWLSAWSTDPAAATDIAVRNKYLILYGVLGLLQALAVMLGTIAIMIGTLRASTDLHNNMLARILQAPMNFFDTTPVGRILNRFSKDVDVMDITIPMNLRMVIIQAFTVFGTAVIICYSNPLLIVVILPVFLAYYLVQKFYIATARQVKRLESITRSPIYSHFSETISGATTLRAFDATDRFTQEIEKKLDTNQKCYYPTFSSSRWLSVRLESTGNLIILFVALTAVVGRDTMDPGLVGLSLSYSLAITITMSTLIRLTSDIETNMVSAERILEFRTTPQEAPHHLDTDDDVGAGAAGGGLPDDWPRYGVVKFDHYSTRYRDGLDLVLKDVSFETRSGEKLGIVGRTGAGKSSLTLSLFRIVEAATGGIYIDGENIAHLGLSTLRSRLTIIPQDPFLFSGTMRANLDPNRSYTDSMIWEALELAHLKAFVSSLPKGLDYDVNEGGENLSVGQRQLVCLARAVLRKTKVLVLDEATAAVDLETDELIQSTIRSQFSDCTVITIAHRLNTIMDSTRIVVLEEGRIKEFDSPQDLLANSNSVFYKMAKDAGLVISSSSEAGEELRLPRSGNIRPRSFFDLN